MKARAIFVGEQPGDREDLQGRPFVGPAGALLRSALREAGFAESDCYLPTVHPAYLLRLQDIQAKECETRAFADDLCRARGMSESAPTPESEESCCAKTCEGVRPVPTCVGAEPPD